ncbi:MBL fold metallo-hydrolase [Gordonia insulae]|uniref:Hydroxyacylglutathione hydrolase n=1 Tax=Gordonia insulae TaxID=2420509 RepID=A0A3G8JKU4_9ACTN|nr:MBL fold metallo-hydrolase [Gordonia insulae]AZG45676.1 Hydroxyacylglutathione hydrolase [Gordonia insulae]
MTTIEVTGHRQREAWAEKVLPPVEEVRPGLWSIPVPMPGNPLRYVLIYALALPEGVALIDTGWNTDESWHALVDGLHATGHDVTDVRHVSITHLHPDHFGLVPRLLEHTDPVLAMHRNDARHLHHVTEAEIERQIDGAQRELEIHGAPTDVVDTGFREIARLPDGRTMDVELDDGDPLDLPGWNVRALWTPGHTAGHLCFVDEDAGVIFTGDHLLPRISPNVSTNRFQSHNPLSEYLISLANTEHLPDLEALPSHEYRFRGLADRVTHLLAHHEERLDEITAAVVAEPQSTAWDITRSVTWSRPFEQLSVPLSRMALGETNAHLVVLQQRGILTPTEGIPIRWTATHAPSPTEVRSPR